MKLTMNCYWKFLVAFTVVIGLELGVFQMMWRHNSTQLQSNGMKGMNEWLKTQNDGKLEDKNKLDQFNENFISVHTKLNVLTRTKPLDNSNKFISNLTNQNDLKEIVSQIEKEKTENAKIYENSRARSKLDNVITNEQKIGETKEKDSREDTKDVKEAVNKLSEDEMTNETRRNELVEMKNETNVITTKSNRNIIAVKIEDESDKNYEQMKDNLNDNVENEEENKNIEMHIENRVIKGKARQELHKEGEKTIENKSIKEEETTTAGTEMKFQNEQKHEIEIKDEKNKENGIGDKKHNITSLMEIKIEDNNEDENQTEENVNSKEKLDNNKRLTTSENENVTINNVTVTSSYTSQPLTTGPETSTLSMKSSSMHASSSKLNTSKSAPTAVDATTAFKFTVDDENETRTNNKNNSSDGEMTKTLTTEDILENLTNSGISSNNERLGSLKSESSINLSLSMILERSRLTSITPSSSELLCKLPKLNIFDPSIRHLVNNEGYDLKCRNRYPPALYRIENNRLAILRDDLTQWIKADTIEINYINHVADHFSFYTKGQNPFNSLDDIKLSRPTESDFFSLSYKTMNRINRKYLYAHVVPKLDVMNDMKKIRDSIKQNGEAEGLPLNVIIVGFDSTSAANFRRKMKRSLAFLKEELHAYVFDGMSIVGDATTPNLAAMLTGKSEEDLPEARMGFDKSWYVDIWPWIFKDFKKRGYVTLFAEDDPSVSAFNLRLKGFQRSPTDHYMRPFWHMVEDDREHRDEHNLCFRQESMTNYTLKYLSSFLQAYPDVPKFGMGFMSYLAHAHPNHLSLVDIDLMSFLEDFVSKGHYNNTMLIVMSDHGSRNGEVRDTMQGKLEERLPWFSVVLPPWFKQRYPDLDDNLHHNKKVIASPFDVYSTFKHLLNYPDVPQVDKGQSLFTRLSLQRTCQNASIDAHWCPCLSWTQVNISSEEIQLGAEAAVDYFNKLNSKSTDKCAELKLANITRAALLEAGDQVQKFQSTNQDSDRHVNLGDETYDSYYRYDITLVTSPGGGKFEVTIGVNNRQEYTVNTYISRINRYGNHPNCIAKEYPHIRKYCYCKDNEENAFR